MTVSRISEAELHFLEAAVGLALEKRDHSRLAVIGFGEFSVALGYPSHQPRVVCKRTPPFSMAEFVAYKKLIDDYVAGLKAAGVRVVPTEVLGIERHDTVVGYLVQPLLPAESLGHKVLGASEPDPEHPFLVALADAIALVSDRLSLDSQVTNWSWDGSRLTLLDVGTPFAWDEQGAPLLNMKPFATMIPAPVRGLVVRDMTKVLGRWKVARGVAADVVANMYREGLDEWVDPALQVFNARLTMDEPITAAEAHSMYAEDAKTFPRLKRLQQLERAWRTTVRRKPYDYFVQETTYRT